MIKNIENSFEIADIKKKSQLKEIWRRFKKNKLAFIGLIIITVLFLLVALVGLIRPYEDAVTMHLDENLETPSAKHWFGTDAYGRDLFARCLYGGRISLFIGLSVSIITMIIGTILGLISGYYGELTDNIIMRIMDLLSAIPPILLALAVVSALGPGLMNLILALTISSIPAFVRIVRASVLGVIEQDYVEAAKAGGTKNNRILFKHILPNAVGPLIVQTTMNVSTMILSAATMSFVGLGVNPPMPEWGAIISDAREYLRTAPYIMTFPGVFIILSSLAINLIGDGLRDALDPKLKS